MFSLIVTIISIALVAALAVASIYYGGAAFTQGSAKANASALVAEAQQIAGANDLYANDNAGAFSADVPTLVSGSYLSAAPAPPTTVAPITPGFTLGGTASNTISIKLSTGALNVCEEVNVEAIGGTPSTPPAAQQTNQQFGCFNDTTNGLTFFYKG
jgi:type II secretory pathway pseudopilin PulG